MRTVIRHQLEKVALATRLRFLTRTFFVGPRRPLYQPLPWCGIHDGKRDRASHERLDLIVDTIGTSPGSVLDVGSAVGFFTISLAERGHTVLGVEAGRRKVHIAQCAAAMAGVGNAAFLNCRVTAESVQTLPSCDFLLCLSIWHHWVRYFGYEAAIDILRALWDRTKSCMFFETGLDELPEYFQLPETAQNPLEWLVEVLKATCPGGTVRELGRTWAFPAKQFDSGVTKRESPEVSRSLFAIER